MPTENQFFPYPTTGQPYWSVLPPTYQYPVYVAPSLEQVKQAVREVLAEGRCKCSKCCG